jgi:alpha-mannosidase
MNRRCWLLAACGGILLFGSRAEADEPKAAAPKETFWVIPHTHWEGAVFKTREEYLDIGLGNILQAMRLLREQPEFRFTLDQVAYVRPFLERFPAEEADFRRFLREGRLQLAGALDVMPDDNMPGGETFIRQMIYGKGYYREKLGVDVTTGWQLDTFGHHAQMPQLMRLGGYKSFWFFRGVPRQDFPSEFIWEGIDGTRIDAYWMPYGYGIVYPNPKEPAQFRESMKARFHALDANARGTVDRAGPSGADVSEPEAHLVPNVKLFNQDPARPFDIKLAVPADFEAVASRRADRTVFKGELNPIFQGIYSSRIELKEWMRTIERKMLMAEKLAVISGWLGSPVDPKELIAAWEPALFNQTHDLASGVMTDHVYEDTIRSYEYSSRRSDVLTAASWDALVSKVDTRGPGTPIVVFNPLGWARSDIVEVEVGIGRADIDEVELRDPQGRPTPLQLLEKVPYADGGIRTARMAFVARDVPALGYAVYHVAPVPRQTSVTVAGGPFPREFVAENEYYRVTIDRQNGAITQIRLKEGDRDVLSGRGNVVARQQDRGDLWELNHGLDGGSRIAMTTRQPVPGRGQAAFSDEGDGKEGTVQIGPLFTEVKVDRDFGKGKFATTVRVYQGLRRIEVTTRLVNAEKYVRYQALFPTAIAGGKTTHEIPFGAIDRPAGIEFPAQNWVDHGDGRHGLALLNVGLPGNVTTDGTMMISLLRSHNLGAYGFGGGYEPGMSSESGFQIGQERTMRYALVPHAGDWRDARVYRDGLEFNQPLLARPVLAHEGKLPAQWGLLSVSNPDVVVSALKPGSQGTAVLRVYEATGRAASGVKVAFNAPVAEAKDANLMEDGEAALDVQGGALTFDLHPYQIRTFRLRWAVR